jgi:apolipoprotein N-acyltransferase
MLGLVHALFFAIAFPPINMWWGVFIAPIPLFLVARDPRMRPFRAALWCGLGVSPAWLWLHFWIKDVSTLGLLPLVMLLSAFTMLYVWLAARTVDRFGREDILLPLIYVGVEFFRASVFASGYPWYLIAHPLIESPMSVLAMPASIAGVPFVSFLLTTYSMLLYRAMRDRNHKARKRAGWIAAGLFACWVLMGLLLIPPKNLGTPFLRFAVVQPDVPQDNRIDWTVRQRYRDWLTLRDITIAAHQDKTNPAPLDVIIWPEGFVPGWTLDPVSLDTERAENLAWRMTTDNTDDVPNLIVADRIRATEIVDQLFLLQESIETPMLVGSVAYDNLRIVDQGQGIEYLRDAMYNSAFIIRDGQVDPVWYDKLQLTPFGEVMPYISASQTLESMLLSFGAQGMEFALDPGTSPRNLSVPIHDDPGRSVSLATPICFEATVSSVCRSLVARDRQRQAHVMINITNDGWFGNSVGGRQAHLQLARWRSIELATPMIRSANTGISAVIDHRGHVIQDQITPLGSNPNEGHLIGQVHLADGLTPFALLGDAFGWLAMLLSFAWGGCAIFASRRDVEPMDQADT